MVFSTVQKDDNSEFLLPSMVPGVKLKLRVIVFDTGQKMTTWNLNYHSQPILCVIEKFRLIVLSLYIKAITRNSPDFSELLLWPDTQSFDIWGIPPRLEVLPLTQKYQTQRKGFDSKMRDRHLHLCNVEVTSLRLD